MTLDDAWAVLESEFNLPDKPEGALTLTEFSQRFGLKTCAASGRIQRLVESGKLTVIECMAVSTRGQRYRATAYLPVKP